MVEKLFKIVFSQRCSQSSEELFRFFLQLGLFRAFNGRLSFYQLVYGQTNFYNSSIARKASMTRLWLKAFTARSQIEELFQLLCRQKSPVSLLTLKKTFAALIKETLQLWLEQLLQLFYSQIKFCKLPVGRKTIKTLLQ